MTKGRPITEEDKAKAKELFRNDPNLHRISKELKRSVSSVYKMLGIKSVEDKLPEDPKEPPEDKLETSKEPLKEPPEKTQEDEDDEQKPSSKTKVAARISDAVSVTIQPQVFTMSSAIIWRAEEVAKNLWNWPRGMSTEEFLDTYLILSYRQRGVHLDEVVVEDDGRSPDEVLYDLEVAMGKKDKLAVLKLSKEYDMITKGGKR